LASERGISFIVNLLPSDHQAFANLFTEQEDVNFIGFLLVRVLVTVGFCLNHFVQDAVTVLWAASEFPGGPENSGIERFTVSGLNQWLEWKLLKDAVADRGVMLDWDESEACLKIASEEDVMRLLHRQKYTLNSAKNSTLNLE
jgi:hypothetical protein